MTSPRSRRLFVAVLLLALFVTRVPGGGGAASDDEDPFGFFQSDVEIDDADCERLASGQVMSTMLGATGTHLGFFGAVAVEADSQRLLALLADIPEFRENPKVLLTRVFSNPPRLEDLDDLELTDRDLDALRTCRRHNCGLKLTHPEILQVQEVVGNAGHAWKDELQQTFRAIVLARVQTYLTSGLHGTPPLASRSDPVDLAARFSSVLEEMPTVTEQRPDLARYLDQYPSAAPPPETRAVLYWTVEDLRRPVVLVRHVVIVESDGANGQPRVAWVSKQVLATHYLDASVGYSGIIQGDGAASRNYFVYLNRSDLDILDGFPAWLRRRMVHRGVQRESAQILVGLREKVDGRAE